MAKKDNSNMLKMAIWVLFHILFFMEIDTDKATTRTGLQHTNTHTTQHNPGNMTLTH